MTVRGIKPITRPTPPAHQDEADAALLADLELMADAMATPSTLGPCPYCGGSRVRCCEFGADTHPVGGPS